MPSTDGRWRLRLALAVFVSPFGCRTGGPLAPEAARQAMDARIRDAVADGGQPALRQAARELAKTPAAARAEVLALIDAQAGELRGSTTVRAATSLYLLLPDADAVALFKRLVPSRELVARRLAWQLAARHASAAMKEAVSDELTVRAARDAAASLSPEAAHAIKANNVAAAYPLLRASLLKEGKLSYAEAMSALNPAAAADDFLTYLAQAGARNRATALFALRSFRAAPPAVHHPSISALFAYAQAPDAELARAAWQTFFVYAARPRGPGSDLDVLEALAPAGLRAQIEAKVRAAAPF